MTSPTSPHRCPYRDRLEALLFALDRMHTTIPLSPRVEDAITAAKDILPPTKSRINPLDVQNVSRATKEPS
jgi:hypothetical protein